jgi:retron-type reverse transcriptase
VHRAAPLVKAVISPLLANIYLHYVLDQWVMEWRGVHAKGDVVIVRYADDFVLGFHSIGMKPKAS